MSNTKQTIGTCTDIEDQKQAEERIKTSEENWRVLAETLPQLVWTTRADGWVDCTNQRFCAYTHATPEQLQGSGWSQFLHPEDCERALIDSKYYRDCVGRSGRRSHRGSQ